MTHCRKCKKEIEDNAILCIYCGELQDTGTQNELPTDFSERISALTEELVSQYSAVYEEFQSRKERLVCDAGAMAEKMRELEKEVASCEGKLILEQKEHTGKVRELTAEISALQMQLADANQQRELQKLDLDRKGLEESYEKTIADLKDQLEKKSADYESKLSTLQRVFLNQEQQQQDENEKLKQENHELKEKVSSITKELDELGRLVNRRAESSDGGENEPKDTPEEKEEPAKPVPENGT